MKRKQLGRVNLSDPASPKIDLFSRKGFLADLKDFKHDEKVWLITETYYKTRTLPQNALFHVYCQEIAEETGQDLETVKSVIKTKYAQKPVLDKDGNEMFDPNSGELLTYVPSTADLNTVEMLNLLDNTRMFAWDFFGIILSLPDEQNALKFKY